LNSQPFWHRTPNPFANYQSTPELPRSADVVVIGAGLTGTAAAYRLKDTRLSVVLLDQGDPAGEASGRNGGNFQLRPENSVGIYEGRAPTARGSARGARLPDHGRRRRPADAGSRVAPPIARSSRAAAGVARQILSRARRAAAIGRMGRPDGVHAGRSALYRVSAARLGPRLPVQRL